MDKVSVHAKRAFLSKLLIVQICCLYAIGITAKTYANNVPTFTASAPENIEAGDQFRLMFTVSSTKELADADLTRFSASIPEGFTVLMGPSRSRASKTQVFNGNTASIYQVTYTYILSVPQVGTFTIPTASITVKGEKLRSQPLVLTVTPAGQSSPESDPQSWMNTIVTMSVSERSPRVNTPVVLECKLYTIAPVDSLANMDLYISPDEFKVEPVVLQNNQWQIEHRFGKNYKAIVFRKLLLYPLRTGELRIGNLHVDAYIRKVDETIDPLDAFFNDGNAASTKKRLHCTGITFHAHE
ncbi:BatD family protein [Paraprevotella clara]|nr:BatD family protein [Paraprevotella clara]